MILSQDVLSKIFLFADAKELGRIAAVSKTWKTVLDEGEQTIWGSLMENRYPHLVRCIRMGPDVNDKQNGFNWKEGFKTRSSTAYGPFNRDLQKDLETVFSPRGIVAFSNCCKFECSSAYNLRDENFRVRQEDGIYFIRLHLNGMNYYPCVDTIPFMYGSLEYLNKHWEQEQQLIAQFCAVIGLEEGKYTIQKPKSIDRCIIVEKFKPLHLEPEKYEEDDDYDSVEY